MNVGRQPARQIDNFSKRIPINLHAQAWDYFVENGFASPATYAAWAPERNNARSELSRDLGARVGKLKGRIPRLALRFCEGFVY
jgi:hypothetical protein